MQNEFIQKLRKVSALVAIALLAMAVPLRIAAQDRDDDDPPGRAARLGHLEGSVSFQPAGESEWIEAVSNRPMTTGDKLWADRDSRADVELGSTSIHLSQNTGFSFLNLDDRTVQIQLNSGAINVRVRRLGDDDVFEIDTPNQAFSVSRPGQYRVEASEDGNYTVITVREGEGESTGNGQTYTLHAGLSATLSGTDRLNADIEPNGDPDDFDRWSDRRDHRFEDSRSSRYVSPDVVGAEDLDEYGDWQPSREYGNVWYPRVEAGWAPYHTGHWAWIDPWGWTWVDDAPWGYAPFHYGRWAFVRGRWGWVPGPIAVRPVYAPALVVFVGGRGPGLGGNVAWFALGPREVYVPSYHVSPAYVNRVNISNTTVNQTTVTNVYNTTIVNKTTVINNVTYVNRAAPGAVTAVPQGAFAGGQQVSRVAVRVNPQQIAAAQVSARVAVAPSRTAVLGGQSGLNNRVAAPPQAVLSRPVVAKVAPPPPPVPFAAKQQALAANPGQPVARQELQRLRPANVPSQQPLVRQAPPGRLATPVSTPTMARPGNQPGNSQPNQPMNRPGNQPANAQPNQPMNRPGFQPGNANDRPGVPPNRAQPNQPMGNQPMGNQPAGNQSPANQPSNRPFEPPARNDRPSMAQPPMNRPAENERPVNQPPANRPPMNQSPMNQTPMNQPSMNQPSNRPVPPPAENDRPSMAQPPVNRPAPPVQSPQNTRPMDSPREERAQPRPQTPPPSQPQRTAPPAETRQAQPPQSHPQPPQKPAPDDKKKPHDQKPQ